MTVTNNTSAQITLALTVSGEYNVAGSGSSPCGSTLAAGKSCTATVTFTPTVNGTTRGAVTVTTNTAFSPLIESLSGVGVNGTAGPLTFTPINVVFTNAVAGATSATKTVTVTNTSSAAVTIGGIGISGQYNLVATKTPCAGVTLQPNGKCSLGVSFSPTVAGTVYGSILVTDNGAVTKQVVSLSSTAVWPVSVSPASINFGNQSVGTSSGAQIVTITNNQGRILNLGTMTASGDFSVTSGGTSPCGASLAAATSCTIGVVFTPSQSGGIAGALGISHSASNTPLLVGLSGTGQ